MNSEDMSNNLIVKWFDAQYRSERTQIWMYDYSDIVGDLECPAMIVTVIISVVLCSIIGLVSIPLGLFLFKAPKERGKVLRGIEEDEDPEDPPVEPMPAIP